jgi:hypothetical protein
MGRVFIVGYKLRQAARFVCRDGSGRLRPRILADLRKKLLQRYGAIEQFTRALELEPNFLGVRTNLGVALMRVVRRVRFVWD